MVGREATLLDRGSFRAGWRSQRARLLSRGTGGGGTGNLHRAFFLCPFLSEMSPIQTVCGRGGDLGQPQLPPLPTHPEGGGGDLSGEVTIRAG